MANGNGQATPWTVLIVDDNGHTRRSIARRLDAAGFVCLEADDPAGARAVLEYIRPDVVVTDWAMPSDGRDPAGLEVLAIAREVDPKIPVALHSGAHVAPPDANRFDAQHPKPHIYPLLAWLRGLRGF